MIRYLFIICLVQGCSSSPQNSNSRDFEAILDAYMIEFSIEDDNVLFVSDMKGWTDSTSIVRIMNLNAKELGSGKLFYTEYKNIRIYLKYGEVKNNKVELSFSTFDFSIPNALNWKIIELSQNGAEDLAPPQQFDEVQIIYNLTKQCIEESDMMGMVKFKKRIKSQCGFCK